MKPVSRGQKLKLSDVTPLQSIEVGVALTFAAPQVVDVTCFGVDGQEKLSDERYMIFYNQKTSPCGGLRLLGAQEGDAERFAVDLSRLPQSVQKLVFTATIDSAGVMSHLTSGYLRISASGAEVARFSFSGADFAQEKAVILGELYLKDVWRFGAVGQGFNGGLSALLKHFGGEEASDAAPAAAVPPPAAPVPAPQPAPAVNLRKVNLEKRVEKEAPKLVSLVKKAAVSLEKAGLQDHQARVALCLDISGSMYKLYSSGKVQKFAERILALGCHFDDDGAIDIFLFGEKAHQAGNMTLANYEGFVPRFRQTYPLEGGTSYGKVIRVLRSFYFPDALTRPRNKPVSADLPVYVMFLTDGDTEDERDTEDQIRAASYEPIFWQFMAIDEDLKEMYSRGGTGDSMFEFLENLDNLDRRYIDNADFFCVSDPEKISDDDLYKLLMTEYPNWLREARAKGLLR